MNGTNSSQTSLGMYNDTTFVLVQRNQGRVANKEVTGKPNLRTSKADRSARRARDRFDRQARTEIRANVPVIIAIHGRRYNLTAWAHAHPGGAKILEKYASSGEDAGEAFEKAGHSHMAYELLSDFLVDEEEGDTNFTVMSASSTAIEASAMAAAGALSSTHTMRMGSSAVQPPVAVARKPLWRLKLFTREDPQNVHKVLGVYSLAHFLYRIVRMLFFDPAAGLTGRAPVSKAGFALAVASVVPHGLLSMSSLIFHTVPRERVVGRPMVCSHISV